MGVTAKDNKSTSRTKKYILEGDNRLELSSKIHEMLDRKRIKYSSAVKSGSGFPATIFVVNGDKVKEQCSNIKNLEKRQQMLKQRYARESINVCV